jgi:outer membrane protein assembly factor BamA
MRKRTLYLVCLVLASLPALLMNGQQAPDLSDSTFQLEADSALPQNEYTIRHIVLTGNKKTRPDIILREIPFRAGETYRHNVLFKKFDIARRQLMNTSLFHEVNVALQRLDGSNADVIVEMRERWYIFPVPYFKPVDRNLNQWLFEQKSSMDRVNYGAKLMWYNTTGRNDRLRFWAISGYTKQFSLSYDRMYIDKRMKWGMNVAFATGKNREINYNTIDNKQVFLKDNNNYVRNFLHTSAELTYRRAINTRHRFGFAYTKETVNDTVVALNPTYFKEGRRSISFPELYYIMTYFDLDYNPYPTEGYAAEVSLNKKGFSKAINSWQFSVKGLGSWHLMPKTFFSLSAYGGIKLPFKQGYFNSRFLGYSDVFMQGYEYYVIDGVAGGYLKGTLARQLLGFNFRVPARRNSKLNVPVKVYGKIFGNSGYVHNPQPGDNLLTNKMLYSGGIGIDIFTIYDFTFKMEWSFNQLGQNGLFLHNKSIF